MRRTLLSFVALLWLGCGITPRDGQFLCPDGLCPAGLVCVSGACRTDTDADRPDLDASTDAFLDTSFDTSGLDAPPLDTPAAPESCAPSSARVALDEDLDGRIDEGCPYFFGIAHPVLSAMSVERTEAPSVGYFGAQVTGDGRYLFTVASTGATGPFLIARRTNLGSPFAAATGAPGSSDPNLAPALVTVTGDGNEVFLQMTSLTSGAIGIYTSTGSPTGTWSSPIAVSELDIGGDIVHPFVRSDGLEIVFTSRTGGVGTLYESSRASRSVEWGTPVEIGAGAFPSMSPDALTLFYLSDVSRDLRFVTRADTSVVFDIASGSTVAPLTARSGVPVRPAFAPATREVFFSLQPDGSGGPPADAPVPFSIFRAEVCRDGTCTSAGITVCTGLLSMDRLHCYHGPSGTSAYAAAAAGCAFGEHLVSVHSSREGALVRGMWANAWLGIQGTTWASGEPYLYDEFEFRSPPEPTECALTNTNWPLSSCTAAHAVVCERDLWPTFTD